MKRLSFMILMLLTQLSFGQSAIQVTTSGQGEPVLFLPGFTTPGSVWDETVQNLVAPHESHLVTYAGFGELAPIDTPWYEPIRQQLIEYVEENNLTNLTLIGHSMGGNLAVDLAAALPDRVSSLILVESIPCMREMMMPGVPASSLQYDSPYNQQMLNMPDDAFQKMAGNMAQNMTTNAAYMDTIANWTMQADRETYVYGYTDLLKLDLRDKLSEIDAPTLILGAGAAYPDKAMIQTNYENQYANLRSKEIVMADESKHFIMFDQPEWFYQQVNNFLQANVR